MDMLAQAIDWNNLTHIGQTFSRLPQEWHLTSGWPLMALLVASVFIGLHGERLTRVLVLGAFIALAGLFGHRLAAYANLPPSATVVLSGAVGGILAYMFYRYAVGLALALALCVAAGCWSAGSILTAEEIRSIFSPVSTLSGVVAPDAPPTAPADYFQYLESVRQHALTIWSTVASKPEAQKQLLITMLAGGAVGLFAGLVLGRLAAILWTSVLGAAGVVAAGLSLAVWYQPTFGPYLSQYRQYVLMTGAGLALLFLLRQLARTRPVTVVAVAPAELAPGPNKS